MRALKGASVADKDIDYRLEAYLERHPIMESLTFVVSVKVRVVDEVLLDNWYRKRLYDEGRLSEYDVNDMGQQVMEALLLHNGEAPIDMGIEMIRSTVAAAL